MAALIATLSESPAAEGDLGIRMVSVQRDFTSGLKPCPSLPKSTTASRGTDA